MNNVTRAQETLHRILAEIGWVTGAAGAAWKYHVDISSPQVPVSDVLVGIDPGHQLFMFLANLSPRAGTANRDEVIGYVNRVNWNLMMGNFEVGDHGEVRFRSSLDFAGGELDEAAIRRTILSSLEAVEAHADGIAGILRGPASGLSAGGNNGAGFRRKSGLPLMIQRTDDGKQV